MPNQMARQISIRIMKNAIAPLGINFSSCSTACVLSIANYYVTKVFSRNFINDDLRLI